MIVQIVVALLVLGIAFYQVVQGMFSALVMVILTVLSAAVAFNFYEPLAAGLLHARQPAYADGAALLGLFILTLLVLRIVSDRFLRGNVVAGVWADRVGGGVCGLITGMVLVGTLMIAAQMLPFGQSILGYRPFDDSLQRDQTLAPFYPDEFTIALVNSLSAGSLSSERKYGQVHDDLLLELFCSRNTGGRHGRVDAPAKAIKNVEAVTIDPDWPHVKKLPRMAADTPTDILVVRVVVGALARDEEDNRWRLPATHFRLVAEDARSYYPLGYLTYVSQELAAERNLPDAGWKLIPAPMGAEHPEVGKLIVTRRWTDKAKSLAVDWVYRLPPKAEPAYLVFRRAAKVVIDGAPPGKPYPQDALTRAGGKRRRR